METNEPLAGARVQAAGTGIEALTGPDGGYRLSGLPEGPLELEVSKEGFAAQAVSVAVRRGEARAQDISLDTAETIEIKGKPPQQSARQILVDRMRRPETGVTMGSQEMRQTTASDAGQVAQRLPGVNLRDGKYVYVRGLGDRYSQTLLNLSSLPSPEPDKRVVPLDLFPVNLIESITITKTYSPDTPGEFSGGSVQIRTIDVPQEAFFKLGVGVKAREGTTFRDFRTYHGGNLDRLTFDDGTRSLPDEVPEQAVITGTPPAGLTEQEVQTIGRSFHNIWNPATISAPLDHKLNISFGRRFGNPYSGSLGVVGAVNWGNKYQNIKDETRRVLVLGGTPEAPTPVVFNDFEHDSSTFEAELSAVLNLTYQPMEGQKLGVRNLWTRSSEDEVREQAGFDGQSQEPITVTRLRFIERSLFITQLFGEHLLIGDTFLEWRGSYALSQRDEPDNRQVRYDFQEFSQEFLWRNVSGSGERDFFLLDENIYDFALDFSIPFNPLGIPDPPNPDQLVPSQRIKVGPAFVYRDRDLDSRRFRFTGSAPRDESGKLIDLSSSPEDLFREKNINPDGFVLLEDTRATDNYEAEQTLFAAYALADFRLLESLRIQAGARVESSDQEVTTFALFSVDQQEVISELKTTDVLPSLNLIWTFYPLHQLRLGGSQTVSRPEFRELAPFEYTDVAGGYTARGNPDLNRAKIWNLDLSWEWYPAPGDILSAGVFYKKFDDPIEQVIQPTGSSLITSWQNADSADLYGVELEVRKSLGFIHNDLRDLGITFNLALVESEVRIKKEGTVVQTNDKRPLQGQAEYLFNAGLVYESKPLDLTVSVMVNSVGERISAAAAFGLPDEIEQPRWSLDVSIEKRFGKSALKLTGENLLDDSYLYKQGDFVTREYTVGFAIGLSYSYSF